MAFDLSKIKRGKSLEPPRLVLYGPHGIGKTTFVASAPAPFLLQFEDGEGMLDVPRHLVSDGYDEVVEVLNSLLTDEHEFSTLGLDSMDWLEPVIWAETCKRNKWKDIEEPGFGKGYIAAEDIWRELFKWLSALRSQRGMQVILLSHCEVKPVKDPSAIPYDRYQPKIHARASAVMQEWADAVLFANYKIHVSVTDGGFNKKVSRAQGNGDRLMYTEERPSHLAKNRYKLPEEMELDYLKLQEAIITAAE